MDWKARIGSESGDDAETGFTWNDQNIAKSARCEMRERKKKKPKTITPKIAGLDPL